MKSNARSALDSERRGMIRQKVRASRRCAPNAAAVMRLLQSARMKGHDPYAYVFERWLQRASRSASWPPSLCANIAVWPAISALLRPRLRIRFPQRLGSCVGLAYSLHPLVPQLAIEAWLAGAAALHLRPELLLCTHCSVVRVDKRLPGIHLKRMDQSLGIVGALRREFCSG